MNPVTFNDNIKEILYYDPKGIEGMNELFPGWETSPLFLYDEPSNEAEATAIVKAYQDDVFEVTPFPVFRLDITVGETGHKEFGKYKAKAVIASYQDGPCVIARIDNLLHTSGTYPFRHQDRALEKRYLPILMIVKGVKQTTPGSCDFYIDADYRFGKGGEWQKPQPLPILPDEIRNGVKISDADPMVSTYMNGLLKSLAAFNLSAMSPNNHIVEVSPSPNGTARSVQWKQARTHYTLITHGHPANNAAVQHGEKVAADPAHELTRMAHNRRAHQRTLKSARFTYARGKTIKVRATWVGPKEWKDKGGKQIYKILEPVKEIP